MSRKKKNRAQRRQRQQQKETTPKSQTAAAQPAAASRNFPTFEWTMAKERAAQLLAEDHDTELDIAATLGVDPKTLYNWKQAPEFAARVAEIQKDLANHARRNLIARKSYRLGNYLRRLLAMEQVLNERGAQPHMQTVAGGKTGLLVRRERMIGSGDNARVVEEYLFDSALVKEMRELEKQAAQEAGQWIEKVAPTTPDGDKEYRGRSISDAEFDALPLAERIRVLQEEMAACEGSPEAQPPA